MHSAPTEVLYAADSTKTAAAIAFSIPVEIEHETDDALYTIETEMVGYGDPCERPAMDRIEVRSIFRDGDNGAYELNDADCESHVHTYADVIRNKVEAKIEAMGDRAA